MESKVQLHHQYRWCGGSTPHHLSMKSGIQSLSVYVKGVKKWNRVDMIVKGLDKMNKVQRFVIKLTKRFEIAIDLIIN